MNYVIAIKVQTFRESYIASGTIKGSLRTRHGATQKQAVQTVQADILRELADDLDGGVPNQLHGISFTIDRAYAVKALELLKPPRYGRTRVHCGITGTEVSLCGLNSQFWMIDGVFDPKKITCPRCKLVHDSDYVQRKAAKAAHFGNYGGQ